MLDDKKCAASAV